jgi:hypothetical protein
LPSVKSFERPQEAPARLGVGTGWPDQPFTMSNGLVVSVLKKRLPSRNR